MLQHYYHMSYFFAFFVAIAMVDGCFESKVVDAIFQNYRKTVRPVLQQNLTLDIQYELKVYNIISIDEPDQFVTFLLWTVRTWKDQFLTWDPKDFDGCTSVKVTSDQIWLPDIYFLNTLDIESISLTDTDYIDLSYDGQIRQPRKFKAQLSCVMAIGDFPFDTQNCPITVGLWAYNYSEVILHLRYPVVALASYNGDPNFAPIMGNNCEFETVSFTGVEVKNTVGLFSFSELHYTIGLMRRPAYYIYVILVPSYLLTSLCIIGIFTPNANINERNERVTLGLTTLLSMAVILNIVADQMPKGKEGLPLLESYKILIYSPTLGHSHVNFMGKIADTLLDAGHEVLVYVPVLDPDVRTNGTKRAPVLRVDVMDDPTLLKNHPLKLNPFNDNFDILSDDCTNILVEGYAQVCSGQLSNKALMKTLRDHHFEIAITELFGYCAFGLFKLLGIPTYILTSALPMTEIIGDVFGVPQPLSYVPGIFGSLTDEMSYKERAMNVITSGNWRGMQKQLLDRENDIFHRYYGSDFPSLDDLAKKSALAFVNADEFFELPRPITHRIIYVGGIGVQNAQKLSNEVTKIVDASDKGVILLSFGSLANSSLLPIKKKLAILRTMANFSKYTFIWKYERPEDDVELFANYSNVYPMKWVPQVDLLNHPKVKVFITHGGMNSLTEAITSGTPTIAIPLFGDQDHNVAVAVKRGVSVFVSNRNIDSESLTVALQEVLQNEKYELNAKRLAQMIAKKPIKPKDLIVKWTEFVAEFQDLSNLDIAGRDFSFVKYFLIDIFAPLLVITILFAFLAFKLGLAILRRVSRVISSKEKSL
uniref:glucuronosyltransferase n=1 Tax=Plectus sambesii TaxID=2011161 RepID=A0A914W8K2_9BILA